MSSSDMTRSLSAQIRAAAGHGQPAEQDEPDTEPATTPDFDGGARSTTPAAPSMNTLIRRAAGVTR
ncbi:hypothetical protein Q0Z83_073880 [Actinoplanes sichuanensis]|uniref:Uncharacterized protein n=1 Tax=Actinoplanes sichuanensis TaxID=512349 RepID=A0ABW4A9P1_9ACTN|nr:hypothetical protein [Actinoplanes sichuanensis]BEL09197.1 hypothetical protein Q0Z83_073880 [Actinoplanes sichuanensis]